MIMISLMHWTWTLDYSNSPLGLFWLCERIAGVAGTTIGGRIQYLEVATRTIALGQVSFGLFASLKYWSQPPTKKPSNLITSGSLESALFNNFHILQLAHLSGEICSSVVCRFLFSSWLMVLSILQCLFLHIKYTKDIWKETTAKLRARIPLGVVQYALQVWRVRSFLSVYIFPAGRM